MKFISTLFIISAISSTAFAGECTESLRLKSVFLTEKRVEVVTKKDGVTFDTIIKCLRANSEQVGDFRFEKPSKEEGEKTFPAGKTVVVSRDEYDPHHWIFVYRHNSEHLSDDSNEVKLLQVSQSLILTYRNRQTENTWLNLSGGLLLTRAHLVEPDTAMDAANDAAPTAGLSLIIRTAPRQQFHFTANADRFYTIDTDGDDKFIYRGHALLGWNGILTEQLTIGLHGGVNSLVEDGGLGTEIGGQFKFRIDNFSFNLGTQYETVALEEESVRGFAHTFGMEILF